MVVIRWFLLTRSSLQASFVADGSSDLSIDDPDFWQKWAERAKLDLEQLANKVCFTA